MNPYDFVPLDPTHPPQRRRPVWHNTLVPASPDASKLYSGHLYLDIQAETPLFVKDETSSTQDPHHPGEHMRDKAGNYIIPGPSLKGMLRTVVETLCGGCMTGAERSAYPVPHDFAPCQNNTNLCIACRIFGMMSKERRDAEVFLGKVNIEDALAYKDRLTFHKPIYTAILDSPKPRHQAFYLNPEGHIAGRKFYFHHHTEPRTETRLREIPGKGGYRNQYIHPLATGTWLSARIDFTALEADEFAALLLALALETDMRHKIGYGKPIGLGTIRIDIGELRLIDYATRYSQTRSKRGIRDYTIDEVNDLINEQMASLDTQIHAAWSLFYKYPSFDRLYGIWGWPPDRSVAYVYPGQRWFKEHPRARISETVDLYPGD